jgi:hypothetical protein
MLPGFRFLFAAIVLSMSILIFGLGAAALLRAAHEEFASVPSWHAATETRFAQPSEAARPVLAVLRVEPPVAEQNAPDNVPAVAASAEPAATTSPPSEPEKVAALRPEEASPPQTMPQDISKSETPAAEAPAQIEPAPSPAEAPAPAAETKVAATEDAPLPASQTALPAAQTASPAQAAPPAQAASPASEETSAPVSPDAGIAPTKIATLGGPSVTIEAQPRAKAATAKPDDGIKKRQHARKAAKRRKIAARARVARQAPQQPVDGFGQPTITVRSR